MINGHEPPIHMEVGEELTTCQRCGTRTDFCGEMTDEGARVEFCLGCGQNYHVTDAPEEDS